MSSPEKQNPNSNITNEHLLLVLQNLDRKVSANGNDLAFIKDSVAELNSKIFDLQMENDKLKKEITTIKEREGKLEDTLKEVRESAMRAEKKAEELSQYSRLENLRFFGIPESMNNEETAEECEDKIINICASKLKVKVKKEDIAAAHRLGRRDKNKKGGRAIIVRFISRKVRDSVIKERRKLKASGIVITEDLTQQQFVLLNAVKADEEVCSQAWSDNGKVYMKPIFGKITQVQSLTEFRGDTEKRKEWSGVTKKGDDGMRGGKRLRSPGQLEMELEERGEEGEGGEVNDQLRFAAGGPAHSSSQTPKRPNRRGGRGGRAGRGRGGGTTPTSIENYFSPLSYQEGTDAALESNGGE